MPEEPHSFFRDRPIVSRRDKVEIENSGAEVAKKEAVEVKITRRSFEISPSRRVPGARIFRRCEQTLP